MITMNKQTDVLRQETYTTQERRRLAVLPLGFEASDIEKLNRIFQLDAQSSHNYFIPAPSGINPIDIVLVNHDNPAVTSMKNAVLKNHPQAHIVTASRGPLIPQPQHHIRGILIAARVLSVLDQAARPSSAVTGAEPAALCRQPCKDLRQEQPKTLIPYDAPTVQSALTDTAPKTVSSFRALVVDDSAMIQKSLQLKLTALQEISAVDLADSGESALEKAENTHYDLIFLDVMMPGIDGYETCSRLRKKTLYKKTPIIMVSGKTSPLDEVKGVIAGCTTYLTKPVQDEAFHKLSCRILGWLATYQKAGQPGTGTA